MRASGASVDSDTDGCVPSAQWGLSQNSDLSRGVFVHDAIKAAIREGALCGGQRLRERDVAEWLSVSRTPVREAFRMLQAQGVLSELSGEGLVVTTLSEADIRELYKVWADLEGIAAQYAAQNASDHDISELRKISKRWDPMLPPRKIGRLNQEFHQAIQNAAHNRYLARALNAVDDSLALLGMNTFAVPGRSQEAGQEHDEIVNSISNRDGHAAFTAAKSHIHRAGKLRLTLTIPRPTFTGALNE